MTFTAPPLKKIKLEHDTNLPLQNIDNHIQTLHMSSKPLQIILNIDIFKPLPSTNVYIGHIKEKRLISRAICLLNDKIPLKGLEHLKRVNGHKIVLSLVSTFNNSLALQEYIEHNVPELNDAFEYFKEINVPLLPPKVSTQYKEASKLWSVHFHPDNYLERIVNNTLFDDEELRSHRQLMMMTFEAVKWYILKQDLQIGSSVKDINVAVVFDPTASSVVAVAIDNRLKHPMQHAAMLAIDNVAKTQNAGAWVSDEEKCQTNRILSGVDNDLYSYLREKFTSVKFGARPFEDKCESETKNASNGPYLCTGYYIYLMREPCVMCAMGLIHARINRTFFCFGNESHGALKSRMMLHLNQSLNHRFEAFTGFI